ncbi:MAG: hypothetical protein ACK559_40105, partial [bacterium]
EKEILAAMKASLEADQEKDVEQISDDEREGQEEFEDPTPVPLKQMMIFVTPLKSKASNEVELASKRDNLAHRKKNGI